MRVVIDLQCCQSGSRFGGIGRYSMALAKSMVSQGVGHEFFILLNKRLPAEHEVRYQFRTLLPQHRILTFEAPCGVAAVRDDLPRTRLAELIRERFIADMQPDVLHVSSLIEGLDDDVITSVGSLFPASRTAVTLYDLIPLVERERYLTNHVLESHYLRKIEEMRKAGMLLAISDYSRREGVDFGGFTPGNVVNISSAVDDVFKPRLVSSERRQMLFQRYGIQREFLMYTGSFDSRKNQSGLVEAFGRLPVAVRSGYQLLIVGNGWDGVYNNLRDLARSYGLPNDAVLFTGRIGDDDLLDLYNLCSLFVFPSLREGFGLPVLEAMSCGVPTIGSNTTSVPEVLGRADAAFDPKDVSSIAAKIQQALTDKDFRETLKTHAISHAKNFAWDISARRALDFIEAKMASLALPKSEEVLECRPNAEIYRTFLEQTARIPSISKVPDVFLHESAAALAANEIVTRQTLSTCPPPLKIGWVTTWNTRCGIASYSRHLVENTGCVARIFAPIGQELIEMDGSEVLRCWSTGCDDLQSLGDAINRSGVDVVVLQMNYGFFDFPALSRLIVQQKHAGRIVIITLHATIDPPPQILNRRLIDIAPALGTCDAVLVHSLADIANLDKIGIVENVILFPQGVVEPEMAMPRGSTNHVFTVGTYGFFLQHKGLEQMIEAVALLRRDGVEIDLEMVNAEYSPMASGDLIRRCRALIRKHGLEANVKLTTAYLDEQDSLRRLGKLDLVVFAYQGTGESSSAAVRMGLAAGVLVAVTPLAIFDDVQELVFKLPGSTPEDLAQGMRCAMMKIADDAQEIRGLRVSSKRWVESHQFSHTARHLSNLVEQLVEGTRH